MIGLFELDMMVRGGAIALSALWSWLLIRDHGRALPARLAVLMNLAIACHVLATIHGHADPTSLHLLLEIGSQSVPVLFWLFARAWFNDEPRVGWLGWLLVILTAANAGYLATAFPYPGPLVSASILAMRLAVFGFAFAGMWIAWRGREGDLVEARRRLRSRLIAAVGAFAVLTNIVELLAMQGELDKQYRSLLEVGILMLTFAFCATMFGFRQGDLFGAIQPPVRGVAREIVDPLAVRLLAFMKSDLPHRDETLTISGLAQLLGEQEYRLRRVINGQLGHRNFAAFLNGYRLEEVRAALADSSQREVPILTIALDAGFGSLGPFNRAFREAFGMTPSEFRRTS
jgi:AraC-like DNA-binding protein